MNVCMFVCMLALDRWVRDCKRYGDALQDRADSLAMTSLACVSLGRAVAGNTMTSWPYGNLLLATLKDCTCFTGFWFAFTVRSSLDHPPLSITPTSRDSSARDYSRALHFACPDFATAMVASSILSMNVASTPASASLFLPITRTPVQ